MFTILLRQRGVSLIETLVCLALLASLGAVSVPAMSRLLNRSVINSERMALAQDIRLLRRFSIVRQHSGYLCAIDVSRQCSRGASWKDGWIGFIDRNNNQKIDPDDEVIVEHTSSDNNKIAIILHARWQRLKFDIHGVLRSSGHFRFCDPATPGIQDMQVIRMNVHGRLSIEADRLLCS